jgi:heme exporter protein D
VPIAAALKRELILAAILLAVGLLLLPLAVFWVGQRIVGPYESEAGLFGLLGHLWSDFFAFQPGAWLLVWSPYATIQLLRLAWHAKRRQVVTDVTDSQESA